ncbi:hypothetical protein GCM10028773_02220 [Spirosoma koreense]
MPNSIARLLKILKMLPLKPQSLEKPVFSGNIAENMVAITFEKPGRIMPYRQIQTDLATIEPTPV